MKPDLVADIGNTRIKWGRCGETGIQALAALPPDDPAAWQRQVEEWQLESGQNWAIAGVHPQRGENLVTWLKQRGDTVFIVDSYRLLHLKFELPEPEKVGLDRLLNAVAVSRLRRPKSPALIVDLGSAVTVDYVNETGAFCGGAIFPGFRLMAQALHEHTALLPLVNIEAVPPTVAESTMEAIRAGIFWSIVGGIRTLTEKNQRHDANPPDIFLTGGDGPLVAPELASLGLKCSYVPSMTLDGIRLTAKQHFISGTESPQ